MMSSIRHLFALAVLSAFAVTARADQTTIQYGLPDARTAGGAPVADGSLVLLLANVGGPSTAGAGFTTLQAGNLQVGSILNGNYQILSRTAAFDFGTSDANDTAGPITFGDSSFPNLSVGDQLAIVWFPNLSAASDFSLLSGASYGLYTVNSSASWTVQQGLVTVNATSGLSASFTAVASAIPEPATYALLFGAGALTVAVVRRRKSV